MKGKYGLPILLMFVFALTRLPGLMPLNFSAAFALMFCAGVYFPKALAWWLPLGTVIVTDVLLNVLYYHAPVVSGYMVVNYIAFACIVALGRAFRSGFSWVTLLSGGVLGAVIFYLVTNTASWIQNPEYSKTLAGWVQALTTGIPGYPPTWTFFRNTLLSGGLFTGLFVAAMKFSQALESSKEAETEAEEPIAEEPAPEESKA